MGRSIMRAVVVLYLLVFAAFCLTVAAVVAWACRSSDLPKRVGASWVFIPALVPIPFVVIFAWITKPRRFIRAVHLYLERRGYAVA